MISIRACLHLVPGAMRSSFTSTFSSRTKPLRGPKNDGVILLDDDWEREAFWVVNVVVAGEFLGSDWGVCVRKGCEIDRSYRNGRDGCGVKKRGLL